jgi:hypothetical protein
METIVEIGNLSSLLHSLVETYIDKNTSKARAEEWKSLASNKRDEIQEAIEPRKQGCGIHRGSTADDSNPRIEYCFCNVNTLPSNLAGATTSLCCRSS